MSSIREGSGIEEKTLLLVEMGGNASVLKQLIDLDYQHLVGTLHVDE